ncbi:TPA: hypothetical protein ACN37W_004332 [Vibrio parahaemolyticus]
MDYLVTQKLIDSEQIAQNSLMLVAPKTSKINQFDVTSSQQWSTSLNGHYLSIGEPTSVPAGMYAKESLSNLEL